MSEYPMCLKAHLWPSGVSRTLGFKPLLNPKLFYFMGLGRAGEIGGSAVLHFQQTQIVLILRQSHQ